MTTKTSFRGSFTALVTPFKNGSLDQKAFRDLVDWQIAEGTRGLVPVGTTGESPTLSHDEHQSVVEWCVEQARGRVPVVAGAGSNSTKEAIDLAQHAEKAGANAVLVGRPYFYGLAVGGAAGVTEVVRVLRNELRAAMALCGTPTLARITRDCLWMD